MLRKFYKWEFIFLFEMFIFTFSNPYKVEEILLSQNFKNKFFVKWFVLRSLEEYEISFLCMLSPLLEHRQYTNPIFYNSL